MIRGHLVGNRIFVMKGEWPAVQDYTIHHEHLSAPISPLAPAFSARRRQILSDMHESLWLTFTEVAGASVGP